MSGSNPRVAALEKLVAQYEKALTDFAAINEELRTLPLSQRLAEVLELNEKSIATTTRLLEVARERLDRERSLGTTHPPFVPFGAALSGQAI
jgi:hypothetical protein